MLLSLMRRVLAARKDIVVQGFVATLDITLIRRKRRYEMVVHAHEVKSGLIGQDGQ